MTWDAGKPEDNKSPGVAPAQIRTNWARLQAMITADHLFQATTQNDEGYHKVIRHVTQAGDIGSGTPPPLAGVGKLYTKTITTTGNAGSTAGAGEHLCFQRGTGGTALQEVSMSVCAPRACVSFVGRSSDGACTINWAYNVSSVDRTSSGIYKITFDKQMPSIYYAPFVSGSPNTGGRVQSQLRNTAFLDTDFSVEFYRDSTSNPVNPVVATAVVYGG